MVLRATFNSICQWGEFMNRQCFFFVCQQLYSSLFEEYSCWTIILCFYWLLLSIKRQQHTMNQFCRNHKWQKVDYPVQCGFTAMWLANLNYVWPDTNIIIITVNGLLCIPIYNKSRSAPLEITLDKMCYHNWW